MGEGLLPIAQPYLDTASNRPTAGSRELRKNAAAAEQRLWARLSTRQVAGVRFNRPFPIGPFICDFFSRGAKLIVEVDGGQHAEQIAADKRRAAYLQSKGYRVICFWNNDVLENIDSVVQMIARALSGGPSPNPSRKREGNV